MTDSDWPHAVAASFASRFDGPPDGVAGAPGRVNLIGEHTDYNEGFVLPMAIDRRVLAAYRPRRDRQLHVHAVSFGESVELGLDGLGRRRTSGWARYVAGVAWALERAGYRLFGADLLLHSTVPRGAGLSSSAALELAVARALCAASRWPWAPLEMARLAQRAENEYVGVACGIMDQIASALGEDGTALLLDCRSLERRPVPLPETAAIVVMNTALRRSLTESAYNERRRSCEAALVALRRLRPGLAALRDVDEPLLGEGRSVCDPVVYRRAQHVVRENTRPVLLAAAFAKGDLDQAGQLLDESHASLRDLYEVSCRELDQLVDLARSQEGCFGARMTGAGFGGSAIALVRVDRARDFAASVQEAYRRETGRPGTAFPCRPVAGARLLERLD